MNKNVDTKIEDSTEGYQVTEVIKIVINNAMVNVYNDEYFAKHPRRKKKLIDACIPPTLNKWGNMHYNQRNDLKQNWDKFTNWIIDKYGLTNKGIERCHITWNYYFPTKHRRDTDNYVAKQISDGLVSSGLLVEDNYTIVNPTTLQIFYDKENPRTEICIEVLEKVS